MRLQRLTDLLRAIRDALPRTPGGIARWIVLPALVGALVSANIEVSAPPLLGPERIAAVFLLDGQAYFGHLEDAPWSETVMLRDVHYLQDAKATTTNLPVALLKRGGEVHGPADGLRIRREKILAIERIGPDSPVARAIAAQRALAALRKP